MESFTQVCWDGESHGARQTPVKAKRACATSQKGILQYQLNTGQWPKLLSVHWVNLQESIKRSSLERESRSTLIVGSGFSSCNPGTGHRPCLSTWWPCPPRDTQSSALLSSLEGWHEFKPSWQAPIFILLPKTPVQPMQPKGFILRGSQARAASWWFLRKVGHEGWKNPQFAKHFGTESSEELQPCSMTTPNAKPFLWGKVSPGSPRNHLAASHGIIGIQILVFGLQPSKSCQYVALHSSQGLSSFFFFSDLERKKSRQMSFVKYLSPCSENLLLVTREEKLLLTIKAMISFPYYFRQKDVLEYVGVREKARE